MRKVILTLNKIKLGLKSIRQIFILIVGYKKYGIPYLFKKD